MKITLEYAAVLDVKGFASGSCLELSDGTKVGALLDMLGIERQHQRFVVALVNGERKGQGDELRDSSHVYLALPVGGG